MKILYLEDSDYDIDLIRRYVRSIGGQFSSAKTTADAVDRLQTEQPDVFFRGHHD